MGGCITEPKKIKPKPSQVHNETKKSDNVIKKGDQRVGNDLKSGQSPDIKVVEQQQIKLRNKRMTSSQFVSSYRIQSNIGTASKVEGPKFVSNLIDGSCKVFRVLNFGEYDDRRLKIYAQLLKLDVYEDQDSNMLILQDYYCGPTLDQLTSNHENNESTDNISEEIKKFIEQVYLMICQFHEKDMTLGNINLFSFRQCSEFDEAVTLTDLSFNLNFDDFMGHANKDSQQQADWESFGFILQTVMNQWPPIFIPHKIQYMDTGNQMINNLLKGRMVKLQQLNQIKEEQIQKPKISVIAGYKLRRDINKLLRIRKRRTHHLILYYPEEALDSGKGQSKNRLSEDMIHRLQTSRILDRIQTYIQEVDVHSEEAFLNYSDGNEKLKKLKAVFMLPEKEKKLQQLKETLIFLK